MHVSLCLSSSHPSTKLLSLIYKVSSRYNIKMTTVVEMEVPMDCPGCENKVRKALEKITGVRDVNIDMKQQRVTVTGSADEKKVLKVARNVTGRDVCLWSCPYHPESNAYHDRYFKKKFRNRINMSENGEKVSSYNYHKHGYHGHDHGYHQERPYSGLIDENASSMFSEENPHFCSIM